MKKQTIAERIEGIRQRQRNRELFEDSPAVEPNQTPALRPAPSGDRQADIFVPNLYDVSAKDTLSLMDCAVYRLSKKNKRANETITYARSNGYVKVTGGAEGMASVWDYDIVIMAISHLTDAFNLYKKGTGPLPTRFFNPHVSDILKFCRRSDGGRQYEEVEDALKRLKTTFVEIVTTTTPTKGKRALRVNKGIGLINGFESTSFADNGRIASVSIELPQWLYDEVVANKVPSVLSVHPDYFLIEPGIGRFLYRLARKAAGKSFAAWSFKLIFQHSGSTGSLKRFTFTLRNLITANDMPEYTLMEREGKEGPVLIMTHRSAEEPDWLESDVLQEKTPQSKSKTGS